MLNFKIQNKNAKRKKYEQNVNINKNKKGIIYMSSLTGFVESKFLSNPNVFIRTSTSESDRSRKTCSLPRAVNIWALILWSAWNAMFIKAQTPFKRREGSSLRVSPHNSSTAPHSKMGWVENHWNNYQYTYTKVPPLKKRHRQWEYIKWRPLYNTILNH